MTRIDIEIAFVMNVDGTFEGRDAYYYVDGELASYHGYEGGPRAIALAAHQKVLRRGLKDPEYSVLARYDVMRQGTNRYRIAPPEEFIDEVLARLHSEVDIARAKRSLENPILWLADDAITVHHPRFV